MPQKSQNKDALSLLKQDHDMAKELLEHLAESTPRASKSRRDTLAKVASMLKAHMKIEEEIFYPAFEAAGEKTDDSKKYYEAVEEHHAADVVLADCMKADPSGPNFAGKIKVLKELIEHHIEEEEKSMFPRAKKLLDKDELVSLGERMETRKNQLLGNGHKTRGASARA